MCGSYTATWYPDPALSSSPFFSPLLSAMIVKEAPKIAALLASLILGKASIITVLSLMFGMSFANSQLSGLLLAQGGE